MRWMTVAVAYVVVMIVMAHFFMPPVYSWTDNTISDLAAQRLDYQWIMQLGFIGFGVLLNGAFVKKFVAAGRVTWGDVPVMLWGVSMLITGFFSAAPFMAGVPYSVAEADMHSLFATLAGVFLTLGLVVNIFTAPTWQERVFHGVFVVLVVGISAVFGLAESGELALGKGLVQRVLWGVSFAWLLAAQYLAAKRVNPLPVSQLAEG